MSASERSASRAERGAPRRIALAVGALTVGVLAGQLVRQLGGERSARAPSGLAGVKLGATLDEARSAQPALDGTGRFRAELHGELASCSVELGADGRVARIDCVFDRAEAQPKLLHTLRQLYGEESVTRTDTWIWRSGRTSLALATAPSLRLTSSAGR